MPCKLNGLSLVYGWNNCANNHPDLFHVLGIIRGQQCIPYHVCFQVVHNILHVLPLFGKKVSASIENEYLQGWPWMMYLIDTACVTVAMGGTAFGASQAQK